MTYIQDLSDVGPGDVGVAGGKAVGLGGLIKAGLPVPPGFVLTTDAYSHFVEANDIAAGIQELASLPPEAGPQAYEDVSERITALCRTGTRPSDIAAELGATSGHLGSREAAVAVRSSAT
ncbi:MAG: phosphoenolpyruvate synthase, partial [Pseudarthrobacter sp.]|nr:phosphoenolpyruvate synthase [Pseudarthrobacter sp.]